MTENKRYSEQNLENHLNRIYDNHECKVIFDEDIVNLLNEQDERINELEHELNAFKPVVFQDMRKGTITLYAKDYGDVE